VALRIFDVSGLTWFYDRKRSPHRSPELPLTTRPLFGGEPNPASRERLGVSLDKEPTTGR
jgi:hypothetical protein